MKSLCLSLLTLSALVSTGFAQDAKALLNQYRKAGNQPGDVSAGKRVFSLEKSGCSKCHAVQPGKKMAGPNLMVIGDKYSRAQLIQSLLEPSARIHPDFATTQIATKDGKVITGVVQLATAESIELFDGEGKLIKIKADDVDKQQKSRTSLMPNELFKRVSKDDFRHLVTYLASLKQAPGQAIAGMPDEIPMVKRPIKLVPFHSTEHKFDHPVLIKTIPGKTNEYVIVEQKTRKIWRLTKSPEGDQKTLFADLSHESITGQFEGVMCIDFHPDYRKNRRYFVNYHVRENGVFSPVIAERKAKPSLLEDTGGKSKRLLKIEQPTDLHWGGMLAFGPDGYLYIGSGDGGPQEDPLGNGQNRSLFLGSILRIDVDRSSNGKPYAIPEDNPFRNSDKSKLPEIWATGFRMPWRFSWDRQNGDMWVGDIGQNLFEEVTIARIGENHGWNVFEGFVPFSNQFRRPQAKFTPPVFSYRRNYGVSVTGGHVYRGKKNGSYQGAYIFGDFESKRIWALTQKDRKLIKVRQIGSSPEKISSFGIDSDGEIFAVGYGGTIFRVVLDDSRFE